LHASGSIACCAERRFQMVYAVSAIAGVLVVGYCISRINSNRQAKKSVQTLFNTK
jgi:hypothetical protein